MNRFKDTFLYVILIVFLWGDQNSIFPLITFGGVSLVSAQHAADISQIDLSQCDGPLSFRTELHSFVHAETSPSPVKFSFLRRSYGRDSPLKVILTTELPNRSGAAPLITSFYLQAHSKLSTDPIGEFVTSYSDDDVTFLNCGGGVNTAISSQNFKSRSKIILYWRPLSDPGNGHSSTIHFRVNAVSSDNPQSPWRGLTSAELIPKTTECISGKGLNYRGTMARTASGIPCQRWSAQAPHTHVFYPDYGQFEGLDGNFCRDPDDDERPWCFRNITGLPQYEICDIPKCPYDELPEYFYEFGETVGDVKLNRSAGDKMTSLLANSFPMILKNYTSIAVFEDGFLVLGTNETDFQGIESTENGKVHFLRNETKIPLGVVLPFWTNIKRKIDINEGYVFFRQSSEPDVLEPLTRDMKVLLRHKLGKKATEDEIEFKPTFAILATWYLVTDKSQESELKNLNSFQVILSTDGARSFMLLHYDMRNWTDADALVGYNSGEGVEFLNSTRKMEKASELALALSFGSNIGLKGRWMYDVSMCSAKSLNYAEPTNLICRKTLTLTLKKQTKSEATRNEGNATIPTVSPVADDCDPNPCNNGGTCVQQSDGAICNCPVGFTGNRCQSTINECSNLPCQNAGMCIPGINSYRCVCTVGFKGTNCETIANNCFSSPCQNEGTCIPSTEADNGFSCECPDRFTGANCELHICIDGTCLISFPTDDGKNCTCIPQLTSPSPPPTTEIVLPACLEEVKGNDNTGYIIWPETESGESGTAPCPRPSFNTARRECVSSRWREPDIAACSLLSTRSQELQTWARAIVSAENASFVAEQIANITSQDQQELIAYDIINVGNILERIIAVLGTGIDSSVGIDVVASVSNVIDASVEEMRFAVTELNAADQLIRVVEDVSFLLDLGSEGFKDIDSRNIKIAISEIDPANFTGQVFTLSEQLQFQVTEGAEELSVGTSISLPSSIMDNISANSSSVSRAQFTAYTKASLFNYTKVNSGILNGSRQNVNVLIYSDHIISASIGRVNFEDLAENVTISISHSNLYIGDGPHCVFWKPPTNGQDASWSSEGCHLVESTDSKTVCKCDHLTNFAFIMDVYGYTSAINDNQKEILRILSYIGCGLSLVGLSFTLISYALFEKLRKDIPSKLLMNLCISLILANIVFLCLQPSYHSSLTSCTAVAALMHYFLLTSLTWMGLEALNLYIAIVIVFKTYFRRYMLKMVIAGWGIPFIIVGISFIVQFGTGVPSYEINNVTEICWLRNELFYGTLVAPLGLVFLFNTIIYFLVLMQLLRKSSQKLVRKDRESRRNQTKPKKRENFRKLRGAVGLMALLGISWGLAFVMIDAAALTFAYLFVVFNSSQGFWVFIFQCVLKKEVSKSWRKLITSKGTQWKERSSRWSRFSSSNTRGSRSTTTTSARSHSAASIKTSYLVPRSSSAFKSEVSIGLDSNGVDVVTRSSGHLNPSFDNDIGNPPNFPPPDPPISISSRNEERVVRRVPRRTDTGLSTTIATQTDIQMTSSDTDSQGSLESLHNIQASGRENFVHHDAEEEERRDSVDEHFGAVRTHSSEAHRAVAMSPSNESGIYSDASVSSQTPQSHHEGHIYVEIATDNDTIDQESPSEGINENRVVAEYDDFNNTQNLQRYEIRESTVNEENDNVNGPTTDSGISVSSDNLIRDRRHEYQSQDSTSSLYSISSMTSGPSSGSEVSNVSEKVPSDPTSLEQTPIPHLWRPPLVIKRSDDLAKASTSQNFQFQRKPVVTGGSHGNKKKNGRKSPKSGASQTRKKSKRRSSDGDNGSKDGSHTQQLDVKMTNFSLNRGSFHDGKS